MRTERSLEARSRELKEQARRIDRLLQELEEVKAQKNKTEGEARAFKEFIAQPEEKLRFEKFLAARGTEMKSEWYIPFVVDELIREGKADCRVLPTDSSWVGVTYL